MYAHGYANVFDPRSTGKLAEGTTLAESLLEPLLARSRLSITYGFISPELSRKIVKYQDPDKPSYHRWDAGAACDVIVHQYVNAGFPPVSAAFWIDRNLPVSRTISYAESPCICVGTRSEEVESGEYRRALYENRYVGERKPLYVNYSQNKSTRLTQQAEAIRALEEHDWRGAGHPTYHGGGIRQAQHIRTSKYTVLSDFLYSTEAVLKGYANMPSTTQRALKYFRKAGRIMDDLYAASNARRVSIIRAFEHPEWRGKAKSNWTDGVYLVLQPPESMHPDDLAEAAESVDGVTEVGVSASGAVWLVARD